MARKYDLISELYSRISKEVVSSSGNWTSFLRSACRNYRLRFDEQLLVFAQRPDATAVLEIERWNEGFGRWVNRGAHGIAVFEDSDRSRQRLLHYFDISDTHESRFARPVPIWTMKPEYTGEVIETLENTFGKLEDKSTLPAAIFSAAKNAAEDNLADYLSDFNTVGEGTDLEYLSAEEAAYLYTELVKDSIAYMLMSRLGLETERFFELDQFDGIQSFASVEAVNAVGVAASDITEMGLSEISKTIMALDRQNRIIDESTIREYNKAENKERSENHEQDRVHDAGRLQPSEPDTSRTTGGRAGALRTEAQDIPEGTPQNPVLQSSDELQADGAFGRGSEQGDGNGEQSDPSDGEIRGRDRGTQGDGYDGLGSQDEQPSEPGSGDRFVRGDIRLDYYDRSHEDRSIPFFGSDADINEILLTTPYLKDSKDVIRSYYETHRDREDQVEYIKGIFNNDYTELILSDGRRVGYKTYQNVLHLWEGSYLSRTKQAYYDWGVIAAHFEALRLLGELHDTIKPIPSLKGQLSLIETQAEPKSSAFAFSQEIIDTVLTRGSGFSEGKLRIYEQFQKSLSSADNIAFLKKEYGWGGVAPVITGTGINEQHDGKGIKLARGFREDSPSILLKWPQVEKRIGELIAADRYLNTAEKAAYPAYLAEKEERERRYQFAGRFNSLVEDFNDYETQINNDIVIIDRYTSREFSSLFGQGERVNRGYGNTPDVFVLPALREILERIIAENTHLTDRAQELLDELEETDIAKGFELTEDEKNPPPEPKKELRFSLGDKVYIGSKEFEILDLEDPVVLFDPDFPILTQDMPRDEFFQKASENPLNDKHLVVVEDEPSVDETDIEAERAINAHEAEFGADGTRVFREPEKLSVYDRTTEILYAVLRKLNMDDVGLDFEGEDIIAFDEDNQWKGKEFYHFLIDECFVFEDGGHVTGIDDELLADFTALAAYNGVLCVDNRLNKPWREYLQAKFDNQGAIILYRIGDFYEIMGDDAEKVAQSLELHLGSRSYLLDKRIPMCGFPAHKLDAYVDMLHDRGYDVVLFEDGKGERLDSPYKDNPMDTMPVARIDVLDENDEVEISTDFTDESAFLRGVFEENERGTKMRIVLYRDDNGRTIPTNFVEEMKPPYPTYEFVDSPFVLQNQEEDLVRAERLINEYCQKEFGQAAYFGDIRSVGLAYTTITDEDLEIQVTANLKEPSIDKYIAGVLVERQLFDSLREMCDFLEDLDFNDLTDYTDDQIETVREKLNPTQPIEPQAPVTPAWEKQPKNKVKTFDLHPEIPMSERHTFDLAANEIEEVGKKERFRRNLMAIQLLKKCQAENRFATPEEQQILSKYVGWGGIPEAFDENNSAWATEYLELSTVLTPDEYASARESTLTAFYTPPVVISAIYKAMEQMGFREGNILEPSCGIGHFIGMLPEEMRSSRMYGVEIDTISAGIAQQLYQRTSIAPQPFEEANIPDSFFDAVVGNVPFGDFRVSDKRYDKNKFLIHDYFFAKSLDKLRPGGVMALITSKGTMDKESPAIRKYIAQRADLIGAIRLPNNTFKGNAGTEVVSDILILQKRDRLIDIEPDWVRLDTDENGVKMNSYFVQHPEMVLGEMKMVSGRFGLESTCEPYDGADLESQLAEAVSNIHGEITDYEMDDELTEEDTSIPADPSVRNFSFTIFEDKLYFRENSRMSLVDVSATAENRIKGLIAIRDSVRALIDLQTEDYPDEYIQKEQARLNELYDAFTKKYGLINSRGNVSAFSQDSSFSLISALEVIGEDGELERKADMFFKRTIKPHTPVTSVDTASEALAVSMGEKARIDMEYMCELTGKTEKEIYQELKGVIFLNPLYGYGNEASPKYLMADEYLSGNVREKLIVAKRSAEVYPEDYTVNVGALEKVQPKDLTASEIAVRLGATWIPPEIVEQFMFEFLGTPRYAQWRIKVHYSPFTSEWNIENKSYDTSNIKVFNTYGTSRINAYKIIEESLNLKDVRIFDYIEDEEGRKKPVLNKKETQIAQAKQELIKQGFRDWIWSDAIRREKLCRLYNDKFNSLRPREYDGSHITFNGMNPEIELREHQRNAVAHILYGGNTLLAHAVGAGKTYEMVAAAMESKRLGLCSKSLFVVPNHLTEQWASEFLQLYPAANILVATKKDFETKNRKRFCGRIATGDYDAVIIGHSQFEKIPMSVERQRAILEQQLDEITDGITDMKRNRGDNFSIKQLEKTKKTLKIKLEKLNDQSNKDDVVTFEELGVDRLFIDESHYYKNLFLYTKMRNVGGIAQTEAQKSSDLYMKCRYLDEITGGRGTVFATGTPISNSMVELYTIQRYLQYNTLVRNGLQHFDAWASTFGETVTAVELTPEGTGYRAKTRFARFYNLPELMSLFKEVADIKTSDMLNLPVPKANYHNVAVKPSEMQKEMVATLAERADRVRGGGVDASVDNMLKITNDGRKLALDQRMINDMLPDFEGSKVNACIDNVFRIWQETVEKRSTQLVFCDLSTPKGEEQFSVYTDMRKKLIERGVPADEIRFIHEADTEAKKLELFKKVRRGEVRILMGSTQKMGAGTNVQDKLIASHDIDCPWRPSDLEQRAGRTIRQGNENPEVEMYRYVTEETFDAYLYQLVEGKQKFASQIMTSKSPVRSAEDIDETALSYAEIKMLATGNPYIKEKMDLDIQVQKLRLLKSNYLSEKYALEDKIIKFYPKEITRRTETIEGLKSDIDTVKQHPKSSDDTFIGMEIKGASFVEKQDAGQAIIDACRQMNSPDPIPLGSYRGFQMELSFDTIERTYKVALKGNLRYTVTLGSDPYGNITRLDNALEGLEKRLDTAVAELENTKKQFETAQVEVTKPFAQEDELKSKTARLDELNILLNMDKPENEIVGDEPDEGEEVPERKEKGMER